MGADLQSLRRELVSAKAEEAEALRSAARLISTGAAKDRLAAAAQEAEVQRARITRLRREIAQRSERPK